jgi:alpha-tectorin
VKMKFFGALSLLAVDQVRANCVGDETVESSSTVTCDAGGMTVSISKCAFDNMGNLDVAEAFMNGPSSKGADTNDGGDDCKGTLTGDNYVFNSVLGTCGNDVQNNGTHMSYLNAVQAEQGTSNDVITRKRTLMIDFGCEFALDHVLTLADGFSPTITNIEVDMGTEEGKFEVTMAVYTDDQFTTAIDGPLELNVPDPIHVQVSNDDLTVQLEKCWATPTDNPEDVLSYPFIDGFCGDDNEINVYESLVVHKNGQDGMSRFSLESFMFNDNADAEIYIHCDISLCDSANEQCEPLCDGSGNFQKRRKRRSAGSEGHGVASVGPFVVKKATDMK